MSVIYIKPIEVYYSL